MVSHLNNEKIGDIVMEVIKRNYKKVYDENGKLISKTPVGVSAPVEKPVYELSEFGDESA